MDSLTKQVVISKAIKFASKSYSCRQVYNITIDKTQNMTKRGGIFDGSLKTSSRENKINKVE